MPPRWIPSHPRATPGPPTPWPARARSATNVGVRFDLVSRARIRAGRRLARWIYRTPALYDRLLAARRADVARGLDPDVAVMLALGDRIGQTGTPRGTPARERREMAVSIASVEDSPPGVVDVRDVGIPGAVSMLDARTYTPRGLETPSPGLVFVHGGGWVTGDLDTHDTLCRRLAIEGRMRVVAVAPRLAPEHPFPAAVDDTLVAFRHVAGRAGEMGIDAARLGLGGDSAGANLSAVTCLATRGDAVPPRLVLLVYPALDATCSQPSHTTNAKGFILTEGSIQWYLRHYIGTDDALRTNPRVSPFHAPDLRGAPDTLVVVAGFDPLLDEGERYAERLREAGTRVEVMRFDGLPHGFALTTGLSPACLQATLAFARRAGTWLRE